MLAANTPAYICKDNASSEGFVFRFAGENFYAVLALAAALFAVYKKVKLNALVKLALSTAILYILSAGIIGFMRISHNADIKSICAKVASRFQNAIQSDPRDMILPFLEPLQYLPAELSLSAGNPIMFTYAIIYPNIAEYLLTVQPFLPYFYIVLGIILEIRPLKNLFWQYFSICGALISFGIMVASQAAEFTYVGPFDLILHTALQYVIFYVATFIFIPFIVLLFRLNMRRICVVSVFLLFMQLHRLGLPYFGSNVEMALTVIVIALLITKCTFSPGMFIAHSLLARHLGWQCIEWGLVLLLVENAVVSILWKTQKEEPSKEKRE